VTADAPAVLAAHGLPARWRNQDAFTLLALGWDDSRLFLATWQAWRDDPQRCAQLHFVLIAPQLPTTEPLPAALADAARDPGSTAAQLGAAWPPITPNLHPLDFDAGRVHLLLGSGTPERLLPLLRLAADAIVVDGPGGAAQHATWLFKTLAGLAAPSATLTVRCADGPAWRAVRSAGFDIDPPTPPDESRQGLTRARHAPRPAQRRHRPTAKAPPRTALVVGAGIAGAAVAQALARLGVAVRVYDRHPAPAAETSGNPAGLFHGTVNPDDGRYARLFRAAALVAQRAYRAALAIEPGAGSAIGLLRLNAPADDPSLLASMRAQLHQLGLPAGYVQALDASAASALAGVPLAAPAWFYPGGGWMSPPAWVRLALATPGVSFRGQVDIDSIAFHDGQWQLRPADGAVLDQAPLLVLAAAADSVRLLARLHAADADTAPPWPLHLSVGQVTHWSAAPGSTCALALPVAGDGYALPLPAPGGLLCGATHHALPWPGAATAAPGPGPGAGDMAAGHQHNLARLQRLTGLQPPAGATLQGRSGWRLHSADRLPIAGQVPLSAPSPAGPAGQVRGRPRDMPRHPGLFVLTALGSRGLTLAPLLARLVAAQATGTPWPMERDLVEAVDPARWALRRSRRTAGMTGTAPTRPQGPADGAGTDAASAVQDAG
jgi:tRNA 5-methylaminomethyl-2-thiouridine biosynthesis bifunctional protein